MTETAGICIMEGNFPAIDRQKGTADGECVPLPGGIMKKLAFVINGRGGVGKDMLCAAAAERFSVRNVSSITPIKEIAARCGWKGEKDDRARAFLAGLKKLTVAYNDFPTTWGLERYREFLAGDQEIFFIHIREPEEIGKFVRAAEGRVFTLLIRAGRRLAPHTYGNASDDGVENYNYDYCFDNDGTPEESAEKFTAFLSSLLNAEM